MTIATVAVSALLWLSTYVLPAVGENIVLFAWPGGRSHGFIASEIGKRLAEDGHNVTILAWDADIEVLAPRAGANVRFVPNKIKFTMTKKSLDFPDHGQWDDYQTVLDMQLTIAKINDPIATLDPINLWSAESCLTFLSNPEVQKVLGEADLIVADYVYICHHFASTLYGVKEIYYSPVGFFPPFLKLGIQPPSIVPMVGSKSSDIMSLPKQMQNWMLGFIQTHIVDRVLLRKYCEVCVIPLFKSHNQTYFTAFDGTTHDMWDVHQCYSGFLKMPLTNGGIFLMLTDTAVEFPRDIWTNVKMVGHPLSHPGKPIEDPDIREFVEGATDGLVLFSLGTFGSVDKPTAEILLEGLKREVPPPMRILWKISAGHVPEVDPNYIKIVSWMPQNDILAHPNTKLFITHGGRNSFEETVYHGVPIVGIPLIADQFDNLARAVGKGFGVVVDQTLVTVDSFSKALRKGLSPEFQEAALRVSTQIKAHRRTPLDKISDWVDYAIKTDGAVDQWPRGALLSPVGLFLPDLIMISISLILTTLVVWGISRCLCALICSKAGKTKVD
ncbi:hypothetical protein AAMO2058_001312400 [Amorphochlora amoebiformis]